MECIIRTWQASILAFLQVLGFLITNPTTCSVYKIITNPTSACWFNKYFTKILILEPIHVFIWQALVPNKTTLTYDNLTAQSKNALIYMSAILCPLNMECFETKKVCSLLFSCKLHKGFMKNETNLKKAFLLDFLKLITFAYL